MLLILQPAVAMTGFPLVNKDLSILRFVAQRAREPTMILMSMRKNNAAEVGNKKPRSTQPRTQRIDSLLGLGTGIDDSEWILGKQIDVNLTNVERGWE